MDGRDKASVSAFVASPDWLARKVYKEQATQGTLYVAAIISTTWP